MAETLEFVNADGDSVTLSGLTEGYKALLGQAGYIMPSYSYIITSVPEKGESSIARTQATPREFDIPLLIKGSSRADYITKQRNLAAIFNPELGDGTLTFTRADASARELTCRYLSGLEGNDRSDNVEWAKMVLTLVATDPFWYANSNTSSSYTTGTVATFFPFFPLSLSNSAIFTTTTVNNDGDIKAWPRWTITGPGSGITIKNQTTDKKIEFDTTVLADGETIEIDTRPFVKTVEKNDGTNLFSDLKDSSTDELWPLEVGNNSIRVEINLADANSQVDLVYQKRYISN